MSDGRLDDIVINEVSELVDHDFGVADSDFPESESLLEQEPIGLLVVGRNEAVEEILGLVGTGLVLDLVEDFSIDQLGGSSSGGMASTADSADIVEVVLGSGSDAPSE